MGKVKAMAMEWEDQFWDHASQTIGNCEHFGEFTQEMEQHAPLVRHIQDIELNDMMREAWDNYWSKYI